MLSDFQKALECARVRFGEENWLRISARERSDALFEAISDLDRDWRAACPPTSHDDCINSQCDALSSLVRLRLFGRMTAWTVVRGNILIPKRKARAVLAITALSAGRPVARTRVTELLWDSRPKRQARASLRQELFSLTQLFRAAQVDVMCIERDYLSLRSNVVWTDVDEVRRANFQHPEALSLMDGELLEDLNGISPNFDLWLTAQREQLRDRSRDVAETVLREQSDHAAIVLAAQQVLQIERSNEGAWRALMHAYAARGEPSMAIEAYDRCRMTLATLLDTVPSPETEQLLSEIRGVAREHQSPDVVPTAPTGAETEAPTNDHFPIVPWVRQSSRAGIQVGVGFISSGDETYSADLAAALNNELIMVLSAFRWLGCVQCFDGHVAKDVDFLLTGAIRPNGSRLRVSLTVVDRHAGDIVVWSERYDIAQDDLLGTVVQIAGSAAAQIDYRLWHWPTTRAGHHEVSACTSWELVELAAPMVLRLNRREFKIAGQWLERAVEIDPGNIEAYAWLLHWYVHLLSQDWARDRAAALERGLGMARTTVELDPQHARGLTLAGHMLAFYGDHPEKALPLHERALALNPNLPLIWRLSGHAYSYLGDGAEGVRRINHARALCPAGPQGSAVYGGLATAYWVKGEFAMAAEAGRSAIVLNPSFTSSYKAYVTAMSHLGFNEQAKVALATLLRLEPGFSMDQAMRRSPFITKAARSLYADGLRAAGLR